MEFHLHLHLGVVAIEKGAIWSSSNRDVNFYTLELYELYVTFAKIIYNNFWINVKFAWI